MNAALDRNDHLRNDGGVARVFLMAKAAVAVYEAAVENHVRGRHCEEPGEG